MKRIKLEHGVTFVPSSTKRLAKKDSDRAKYVLKLRAMMIGDSFFSPNAKVSDLDYLRRVGNHAGVYLKSRKTESDTVHGTPGVRTWRISAADRKPRGPFKGSSPLDL